MDSDSVYITVSVLPTLRKYNKGNMWVGQISKWHKGYLVMKTIAWEAAWVVWFCCKCASKYCMTFQPGHFACTLHSFNISDCGRGGPSSLPRLVFGIYSHSQISNGVHAMKGYSKTSGRSDRPSVQTFFSFDNIWLAQLQLNGKSPVKFGLFLTLKE